MRNRQHRVWGPDIRALTPTETETLACCVGEHWPGRPFARVWIEWNSALVIDWEPGAWPVTQTRLPLDHLQAHAPPPAALPALQLAARGERASAGVTALRPATATQLPAPAPPHEAALNGPAHRQESVHAK